MMGTLALGGECLYSPHMLVVTIVFLSHEPGLASQEGFKATPAFRTTFKAFKEFSKEAIGLLSLFLLGLYYLTPLQRLTSKIGLSEMLTRFTVPPKPVIPQESGTFLATLAAGARFPGSGQLYFRWLTRRM
jgi:hypothetical protein